MQLLVDSCIADYNNTTLGILIAVFSGVRLGELCALKWEDIDMKAMSQCMHFGKSVMDNGYGKFRELLEYKLTWRGKKLVRVDRFFPSSKKCCKCGNIKKELKLSDRVYLCTCGNRIDRDLNAAINIREEARRMLLAG